MREPDTAERAGGGTGLVGRERLLAALDEVLAEVSDRHVRTAVLSAPAGAGKTAVIEAFLRRAACVPGVHLLSAVGDEWESRLPMAAYGQLMQVAPVRSAKAYDPGATPPPALTGEFTPTLAVHHAATLMVHLEALQATGPVVVAVDDAHDLDPETLRVLLYVIRRLRDRRVLFLLTVDPARSHALPVGLVSGHRVRRFTLEPLDAAQVQELARHRLQVELSPAAAQRVVEHTGGLPLPVVDLLEEVPPETWQGWFPSLPVPARVRDRIRARMGEVEGVLQDVVHAVAVLGGAARLDRLCEVVDALRSDDAGGGRVDASDHGFSMDDLLALLDRAHGMGLLQVRASGTPAEVSFVDPGAQGAVLETVPPSRRRRCHQLAADTAADEGERLRHRVAAAVGVDEVLAAELEDFADRRARQGIWQEAAKAMFSACRLSATEELRSQRLLRAVDAMVGAGDIAQAQSWVPTLECLPESPQRESVLGYLATAAGRDHAARAHLTAAWEAASTEADPAAAAAVAQRLVLHKLALWDGPGMIHWARSAMAMAPEGDPAHTEAEAMLGLGLYAQGRMDEAERAYAKAGRGAWQNAQRQRFRMGAGWLGLRLDQVEQAVVDLEASAPVEPWGGSLRISLWAEGWLARAQLVLGQWDAAAATVARGVSRLQTADMPLLGPLLHWTGTELWSLRGDWDRAQHHLAAAVAHHGDYRVMRVPAQLARARFHEARADYESALEALEPLTELDPWTPERVSFWPWQDSYVNALVMADRLSEAERFLTELEAVPRARLVRTDQARVSWVRGRVVSALGDPDEGRAHFDQALRHLDGRHRPYLRARVLFAYGQSMRRAGKRRAASSALDASRDLYRSLGAVTYVERCDRELKATGAEGGPEAGMETPARLEQLTPQEAAVARLVAGGATNKEAARSLFLAEKTVQYHLTRIYRKLGVRSRSELAARYHGGD